MSPGPATITLEISTEVLQAVHRKLRDQDADAALVAGFLEGLEATFLRAGVYTAEQLAAIRGEAG